jgi:hypothetical protein
VQPSIGDLVIGSDPTEQGVGVILDTWRDSHYCGYVQVMYLNGNNDDCMDGWSPVEHVKIISKGRGDESW